MGFGVLGMTAYQMIAVGQPAAEIIGFVGLLALLANLTSIVLLLKFRDGDANVRSVWLCSRNDAIGNVAVICTSGAVMGHRASPPDPRYACRPPERIRLSRIRKSLCTAVAGW